MLDWARGKPEAGQHYCKQSWVYGPCLLAWRGEAKARDCIFAISQTGHLMFANGWVVILSFCEIQVATKVHMVISSPL